MDTGAIEADVLLVQARTTRWMFLRRLACWSGLIFGGATIVPLFGGPFAEPSRDGTAALAFMANALLLIAVAMPTGPVRRRVRLVASPRGIALDGAPFLARSAIDTITAGPGPWRVRVVGRDGVLRHEPLELEVNSAAVAERVASLVNAVAIAVRFPQAAPLARNRTEYVDATVALTKENRQSLSPTAQALVAQARRGADDALYVANAGHGLDRLAVREATVEAVRVALEALAEKAEAENSRQRYEQRVAAALALPDDEWLTTWSDGTPALHAPTSVFPENGVESYREDGSYNDDCRVMSLELMDPRIQARLDQLQPEHERRLAVWTRRKAVLTEQKIAILLALPDDVWLATAPDGGPGLRIPHEAVFSKMPYSELHRILDDPRIRARVAQLGPEHTSRRAAWKRLVPERVVSAALALSDEKWLVTEPDGGPDLRPPDEALYSGIPDLDSEELARVHNDPRIQARLARLRPECERRLAKWREKREAAAAERLTNTHVPGAPANKMLSN